MIVAKGAANQHLRQNRIIKRRQLGRIAKCHFEPDEEAEDKKQDENACPQRAPSKIGAASQPFNCALFLFEKLSINFGPAKKPNRWPRRKFSRAAS